MKASNQFNQMDSDGRCRNILRLNFFSNFSMFRPTPLTQARLLLVFQLLLQAPSSSFGNHNLVILAVLMLVQAFLPPPNHSHGGFNFSQPHRRRLHPLPIAPQRTHPHCTIGSFSPKPPSPLTPPASARLTATQTLGVLSDADRIHIFGQLRHHPAPRPDNPPPTAGKHSNSTPSLRAVDLIGSRSQEPHEAPGASGADGPAADLRPIRDRAERARAPADHRTQPAAPRRGWWRRARLSESCGSASTSPSRWRDGRGARCAEIAVGA